MSDNERGKSWKWSSTGKVRHSPASMSIVLDTSPPSWLRGQAVEVEVRVKEKEAK
jgi:hypothetical protein